MRGAKSTTAAAGAAAATGRGERKEKVSAYFAYQAESAGYVASPTVFWFFVLWAWMHAAVMWHSVYEGRQGTAVYGGVAFALYSLAAAVWLIAVM